MVASDTVAWESAKPPNQRNLRIDRVNANENRNANEKDTPRRVVVMFRRGGKRYALKIAPAWSARYIRERTIYRQLSQPKVSNEKYAFDPRHTVRMVFDGKTDVPLDKRQTELSFPVQLKGVTTDVRLEGDHAKKALRGFRKQARKRNFEGSSLPVLYFVTEAPEEFGEVTHWLSAADRFPKDFAVEFREKFFHAFAPVYLRAHLTYGFGHFDLHSNNMLCKVTFQKKWIQNPSDLPTTMDALPHIHVVPKLYDYDTSYSSAKLPPMSDLVRTYGDPKDADSWFHWMCAANGECPAEADPKFPWERAGAVHDLSRLIMLFLDIDDEPRLKRARTAYANVFPRSSSKTKGVDGGTDDSRKRAMVERTFDLAVALNKEVQGGGRGMNTFESRARGLSRLMYDLIAFVVSERRPPMLYPVDRIGSDWNAIYRNRQTFLKRQKRSFPQLDLESLDGSDEETDPVRPPSKRTRGIWSWFGW